jgi:hypothetical protein
MAMAAVASVLVTGCVSIFSGDMPVNVSGVIPTQSDAKCTIELRSAGSKQRASYRYVDPVFQDVTFVVSARPRTYYFEGYCGTGPRFRSGAVELGDTYGEVVGLGTLAGVQTGAR